MRYLFVFLFLTLFSCNNEEPAPERLVYECDSAKVLDKSRVWCCVGGPVQVIPGETLTYTFMTSIPDSVLHWDVKGDITIIEGQSTAQAKLLIGPNFTSGSVIVKCEGDMED